MKEVHLEFEDADIIVTIQLLRNGRYRTRVKDIIVFEYDHKAIQNAINNFFKQIDISKTVNEDRLQIPMTLNEFVYHYYRPELL